MSCYIIEQKNALLHSAGVFIHFFVRGLCTADAMAAKLRKGIGLAVYAKFLGCQPDYLRRTCVQIFC